MRRENVQNTQKKIWVENQKLGGEGNSSPQKALKKTNMVWNRYANLQDEGSSNNYWQQYYNEVGSLLNREPKRVTQNWIEKLFIDHKHGTY